VPDPEHPGQMKTITVRPDVSEVAVLVGRLLNLDEHEADLYGLYAPKKSEVAAAVVGQPITPLHFLNQHHERIAFLGRQPRQPATPAKLTAVVWRMFNFPRHSAPQRLPWSRRCLSQSRAARPSAPPFFELAS
jgi:hypothetical protein